ncbi:MAG TPA: hypothetical protein VIW68_05185 [Candidatus Sulfotelmatobacter sp.]
MVLLLAPEVPAARRKEAATMLRYLAVVSLFLASISATAQMTHEETVVRTAYAKLSYAIGQGAVSQLAMEALGAPVAKEFIGASSDQRVAAPRLGFILGDFTIGDARDILDRKAVDLISPAVGETLQVMGGRYSYVEAGRESQWYRPEARWQPAPVLPPEVAETTLEGLYQLQWHQKRPDSVWQRYASYSVTVSFHGKSHGPYRALFMFGRDAQGNEVVEPEDGTTDATGLASALHEHLFADAFVLTRLRTTSVVANWINTKQTSASSCSEAQGICCDLVKLQCGPAYGDVAKALSTPLPTAATPKNQ